ncbi:hypothetical protein SNEBB_001232 [Seison nebaliae]|nr:hypothetical protein SNEBB_001232 [Seison nebaliae]
MAQHGEHDQSELDRTINTNNEKRSEEQMNTLIVMSKNMQNDMDKFQKKASQTETKQPMKTRSKVPKTSEFTDKSDQFIIGNLNVDPIRESESIIDWAERTKLYFLANRIPDKMWKELTLASLPSKLRAIIQVAENLREIHFNSHDEIIKYLVTKTEGEELKAKFKKSFQEKTESPSQYLLRLTHMSEYILTNDYMY